MSECIIYQSVNDQATKQPFQQLSNLSLTGISTTSAYANTDGGKLYADFSYDGPTDNSGTFSVDLYKDVLKSELVASAIHVGLGLATVFPQNKSGLSGTINFAQYQCDDSNIVVIACLSTDDDLSLDNLKSLSDYDAITGFAKYHLEAFRYLMGHLTTRYRSELYNPNYVDTTLLNGAVGGFDLSRCLSFLYNPVTLRQCAARYACQRISERQAVNGKGIFATMAHDLKIEVKNILENIEIEFDSRQTRQAEKSRSMRTWKRTRGG